jgi:hypothetical protein
MASHATWCAWVFVENMLLNHQLMSRSAPFSMRDVGKTFLKMPRLPTMTADFLVRVDVQLEGATIFIVLSKEEKSWPYRIVNRSDVDLIIYQKVLCVVVMGFERQLF